MSFGAERVAAKIRRTVVGLLELSKHAEEEAAEGLGDAAYDGQLGVTTTHLIARSDVDPETGEPLCGEARMNSRGKIEKYRNLL